MDDEIEIEMLLKANEQILLEAASSCTNEHVSVHPGSSELEENEINFDNEFMEGRNTIADQDLSNSPLDNSFDELQEILDDQIVSFMVKQPTRHIIPLHSIDSDEESITSEELEYEDNNKCEYINEILADDEPRYEGRVVEEMRKQVGTKSKPIQNKTIIALVDMQKLILERHNLLTDLESQLQKELLENKEKQKKVRENIASINDSSNLKIKESNTARCYFKKFGMPYFKDNYGFSPPPNEDYKKKVANGEVIITDIPKIHHWTKSDKDKLTLAIKNTLIEENSERLVKEIEKLKGSLVESLARNKKEIARKISMRQDELRFIRSKTFLELVCKEHTSRDYDWMKYSASVFNGVHSSEECKRFWHTYLKPSLNKRKWDPKEDVKLLELAEQRQFQDWDAIARELGTNRGAYHCFIRFRTRLHAKNDFNWGKWSKEEDEKLLKFISNFSVGDFIPWTKVASHMENRAHNQIYNRWTNSLNPKLLKGKFTKEEDLLIVSGVEVFKATYKEIATLMRNRTASQIRERYERNLLPRTSKVGSWSLEEDEKLLDFVKKHGTHNWVAVAKEFKTRTRTQVRQRYNFIQNMLKNKPGWSINSAKRRQIDNSSKIVQKTTRLVEKIKNEVDKVEKTFNLSKLEKDTFRIEKLKEMRDKICSNKFQFKRKRKVFCDSSEVNNLLMEYFKPSIVDPVLKFNQIHIAKECDAQINKIVSLAKYFGHELELPQFEDDIINNPRLNPTLKKILVKSLDYKVTKPASKAMESIEQNMKSDVPMSKPMFDDTILMNPWWHSPAIDITKLNFSEFFKRTVFDYSNGMHKDIWTSKLKRFSSRIKSTDRAITVIDNTELPEQQFLMMPPNLLNTVGLRSILISRTRLKQDTSIQGFANKLYQRLDSNTMYIKSDGGERELLDRFQETMFTLFSWPKVLSITSITETSLSRAKATKVHFGSKVVKYPTNIQKKSEKKLAYVKDNKVENEIENKAIIEQEKVHIRQIEEHRRGIRCRRKMKIEHLLRNSEKMRLRNKYTERVRVNRKAKEVKKKRNLYDNQPSTSRTRSQNRLEIKPSFQSFITYEKSNRKRKIDNDQSGTLKSPKCEQ